jgi:hypothetical protein
MGKGKKRKGTAAPSAQPGGAGFGGLFQDRHPDLLPLALLGLVLLVFFYPVLFGGRTFLAPDSLNPKSMQPFVRQAIDSGAYPLWNPYIFSGMPSFGSLMAAPYVDVLGDAILGIQWLLQRVLPLSDFFRVYANYLLLGAFVYLLLRSLKVSPRPALFAGLALVLMPQVVAYSVFGHNTKLASAVLIPLIFLLAVRLLDRPDPKILGMLGLGFGLQLLRAHAQICFYTYLLVSAYFISWSDGILRAKEGWLKPLKGAGLLALALALGIALSAVLYLPVWEYSEYSIRGGGTSGGLDYGYATDWSFPPSEILTYLVPGFMGFGGQTYWGAKPFTDFPQYFSMVVLVLAGLGMILNKSRMSRFFAVLAGIALLLSFGKHFPVLHWPFFKLIPFFNKFRAPDMIQVLFEICMAVLAGFGLESLTGKAAHGEKELKRVRQFLMILGGILIVLLIFLAAGKGTYLRWAVEAGQSRWGSSAGQAAQEAYRVAMSDAARAILLFAATAGAVLLSMMKKIGPVAAFIFLAGFLTVDLWTVDRRFMDTRPAEDAEDFFAQTPDVQFLKSQKDPFRILPAAEQRPANWYAYHFIENADGYSAAKVRIYRDLLEAFNMPRGFIQKYVNSQYRFLKPEEVRPEAISADNNFLRLLNVRFILSPYPLPDTSLNVVLSPRTRGGNFVFELKNPLGRVFFPREVRLAEGKDAILSFMKSPDFDPAVTAVLEKAPPFAVQPSDGNQASVVSHGIHHIEIAAQIQTPCLMTVSEIYYPAGWKATVDGKETEIFKTDYVLRSLFLEPGSHQIRFDFKPDSFKSGLAVSLASLMVLAGFCVWGAFKGGKKSGAEPASASPAGPVPEESAQS